MIKNFIKKAKSMKKGMVPKTLQVQSSQRISHSFQRIVLSGEDISKFDDDCIGGYVKLLFNPEGGTDLSSVAAGSKPQMRTYTIRDFDRTAGTLTIDFVLHSSEHHQAGIASQWAAIAKEGDSITMGGPGPIQAVEPNSSSYLFAADMTSLPALAVNLASLEANAKGIAFVQVADADDIQELKRPQGIELKWLIGEYEAPLLAQAVEALPELKANTSVWCASEFSQMRAIRRCLSEQANFERKLAYFSSYWKPGVTEDGHKTLKQQDAKEFSAK